MSSTSDDILDVAIVGAGVSGVYSGWRMLRDGRGHTFKGAAPKITVFEGSDRIGGRMLTHAASRSGRRDRLNHGRPAGCSRGPTSVHARS